MPPESLEASFNHTLYEITNIVKAICFIGPHFPNFNQPRFEADITEQLIQFIAKIKAIYNDHPIDNPEPDEVFTDIFVFYSGLLNYFEVELLTIDNSGALTVLAGSARKLLNNLFDHPYFPGSYYSRDDIKTLLSKNKKHFVDLWTGL